MRSPPTEIQVTSLVPANGQRELRAGASANRYTAFPASAESEGRKLCGSAAPGAGERTAGAAASERETIAATNPRQALRAMALRARASVDLAGASPATSPLREALKLWQSMDAPYEVARTRMLLADSYHLEGDESGARQDLEEADAAFE